MNDDLVMNINVFFYITSRNRKVHYCGYYCMCYLLFKYLVNTLERLMPGFWSVGQAPYQTFTYLNICPRFHYLAICGSYMYCTQILESLAYDINVPLKLQKVL